MKERKNFLEKMKRQMLLRKDEVLGELKSHKIDKDLLRDVKDTGDEALSLSMEKLQNSLDQGEIDEVHAIDDALARMEHGEFGLCVDCREPILDKRLQVSPYAARCIVCQEKADE